MQPAGLYTIASWASPYYGLAFNDITTGNNDYTPSGYSGGLYPATVGYDMASGLGSPILAHAATSTLGWLLRCALNTARILIPTNITGVSPNKGPSTGSTSVTITGSGFLPIAGADELEVGTNLDFRLLHDHDFLHRYSPGNRAGNGQSRDGCRGHDGQLRHCG